MHPNPDKPELKEIYHEGHEDTHSVFAGSDFTPEGTISKAFRHRSGAHPR
jgi:hypothetical protein